MKVRWGVLWPGSGCILKVQPTRLPDGWGVGRETTAKANEDAEFWSEQLEGWCCYELRCRRLFKEPMPYTVLAPEQNKQKSPLNSAGILSSASFPPETPVSPHSTSDALKLPHDSLAWYLCYLKEPSLGCKMFPCLPGGTAQRNSEEASRAEQTMLIKRLGPHPQPRPPPSVPLTAGSSHRLWGKGAERLPEA